MVQDPKDAAAPEMPSNAMHAVQVDHCVPLGDMPALLTTLTQVPASDVTESAVDLGGAPVLGLTFACPECKGPLSQVRAEGESIVRFRCHVGHAFTIMSLLAAQVESREEVLWTTIRSLEDEAVLSDQAVDLAQSAAERDALSRQAKAVRAIALNLRDAMAVMPMSNGTLQTGPAVIGTSDHDHA